MAGQSVSHQIAATFAAAVSTNVWRNVRIVGASAFYYHRLFIDGCSDLTAATFTAAVSTNVWRSVRISRVIGVLVP